MAIEANVITSPLGNNLKQNNQYLNESFLKQVNSSESTDKDTEPMAQVTSVSQLSDVQPTDWAFQALQSLVERYSCIAGYPDGTYRGDRALTRYEFAAGVNACLDQVNELIAATADLVTREDLATIQRLQEEFAAELTTLRGRVDVVEASAAELEANQFSPTTKLGGEVITYLNDAFGENASDINNTNLSYRLRLDFNPSFTGEDRLRTRLQATNLRLLDTGAIFGGSQGTRARQDTSITGITMAIVTHEMGFAREVADRILFLNQGQLAEDATPKEFFNNPQCEPSEASPLQP